MSTAAALRTPESVLGERAHHIGRFTRDRADGFMGEEFAAGSKRKISKVSRAKFPR